MPTSQEILTDVDLRYRNSFTTAQKLVWFNEEQRELFDILEIDSPPYTFQTMAGENFYPLPRGFDAAKIKVVTYQMDDSADPTYIELEHKRNDNKQYTSYGPWYTIVSDAMYLYVPSSVPDARNVYIYRDADPADVLEGNLGVLPDLPTKYQEILKLGILKRIAGARKDITMRNNYDMEYQQKIDDILLLKKMKEPEWVTPVDVMPRAGGRRRYGTVASYISQ